VNTICFGLLVEIETTQQVSDDSASVYTLGLADEIQRTRSNSLASQPLLVHIKQETVKVDQVKMVVKVDVEKEVVDGEEEKAHEFAQGVVKEVQRSRSGSLVEVKVDTEVVRCVDEGELQFVFSWFMAVLCDFLVDVWSFVTCVGLLAVYWVWYIFVRMARVDLLDVVCFVVMLDLFLKLSAICALCLTRL